MYSAATTEQSKTVHLLKESVCDIYDNEPKENYVLYRLRVKDPSILLSSTYGLLTVEGENLYKSNSELNCRHDEFVNNDNYENENGVELVSKNHLDDGIMLNKKLTSSHHFLLKTNTDVLINGKLSTIRIEYILISFKDATTLMKTKKLTKEICGEYFTKPECRILYAKCKLVESENSITMPNSFTLKNYKCSDKALSSVEELTTHHVDDSTLFNKNDIITATAKCQNENFINNKTKYYIVKTCWISFLFLLLSIGMILVTLKLPYINKKIHSIIHKCSMLGNQLKDKIVAQTQSLLST